MPRLRSRSQSTITVVVVCPRCLDLPDMQVDVEQGPIIYPNYDTLSCGCAEHLTPEQRKTADERGEAAALRWLDGFADYLRGVGC